MPELKEVLEAWDRGEEVTSVEMGGLGDGYEQCIQNMAFEIVRYYIDNPLDVKKIEAETHMDAADRHYIRSVEEKMDEICLVEDKKPGGGFSGAQVGAAKSLAAIWLRRGYDDAMSDEAVADRKINVKKQSPSLSSVDAIVLNLDLDGKLED